MSEAAQQSSSNGEVDKKETLNIDDQIKEKPSAFEKYKSPNPVNKKCAKTSQEKMTKDALDVNVSPLWRDMFQNIKNLSNWLKDHKRAYDLWSPDTPNKIALSISPAHNDSFLGFQKDDFQLKNESERKHLKMTDFHYPETLLSKSNSSKKMSIKKIMNDHEMEDGECLKRRLFEKESSDYDNDESSNYNILNYTENYGYVDRLITPPPKASKRIQNVLTDQKQSGIKYIQNESLEKLHIMDPHNPYYMPPMPQYIPQVIYKSHKYKHTSYPYLIPFCNKCNLPPILPMHPDFEMEMIPPVAIPPPSPEPMQIEREPVPTRDPISTPRPRHKSKPKKKPSVDENGKRIIRRRKRKTYEQIQILIQEFQSNPEWSKENMQEVSRKTGLSEAQVYKWGWDQKRKMDDPNHDIHDELRLYKQQEEEEEEEQASITKLRLHTSQKKQREKEYHPTKDKICLKTKSINEDKSDWNKENLNPDNKSQKPETRGVKRKQKEQYIKRSLEV